MNLKELLDNPEMLEIGRKAVEDTLIRFRDSRISVLGRGNGLVICEPDGTASHIIRLGVEDALRIALTSILEKTPEGKENDND